jgi:hypothetical protein
VAIAFSSSNCDADFPQYHLRPPRGEAVLSVMLINVALLFMISECDALALVPE